MAFENNPETVNMGVYEIGDFSAEFEEAVDYMQDITGHTYYPSEQPIGEWFPENFEARIDEHHLYLRDKGNVREGEEIKPDAIEYAKLGNDFLMIRTILQVSANLYRRNRAFTQ